MKKQLLLILCFFGFLSPFFSDTKFYQGNKGSDIVLAIPEAKGVNLSSDREYLKILIQTQLTDSFQLYSPIKVVDRQNEDITDEEIKKSEDGSYIDEDYAEFGKKINAKYVAVAQLINTEENFLFSVRIIETEKNQVKWTAETQKVVARQIKDGSAVNKAVKDLLSQMGIVLTDAGLKSINGGVNESTLKAQENLSKGIDASRRGTTIEAIQYYYAASEYSLDNTEINSRLNAIQSAISTGNIGDQSRGEDDAYEYWKKTLGEADDYFEKNPPYEIIYSKNINRLDRTLDELKNKTNSISFEIGLIASNRAKNTINSLEEGIKNSPFIVQQAVAHWPEYKSDSETKKNEWLLPKSCYVTVQILNDLDKVIGEEIVELYVVGPNLTDNRVVNLEDLKNIEKINVSGIKSSDLTDNLLIRIATVKWNGKNIDTDYIRISTLEEIKRPMEVAYKAEQERIKKEARYQKELEAKKIRKLAKREEKERKAIEKIQERKKKEEEKQLKKNEHKKKWMYCKRNAVYCTFDIPVNFHSGDVVYGGTIGFDKNLFRNLFFGGNFGMYGQKDEKKSDEIGETEYKYTYQGMGETGLIFGTAFTSLYLKAGMGYVSNNYPGEGGLCFRGAVGIDFGVLEFEYAVDYTKGGYFTDRFSVGLVLNHLDLAF